MRAFLRQPFDDVLACLGRIMVGQSALRAMAPTLIAMIVTWFIYVPVHELLHCAGCVLTGGEVSRLEVSPQYGGTLLAKVFPFVVSGSDYAGQLTGFDTKGNDLIYLATDFLPFMLTVLIGVPVLRLCMRKRRPILFGIAVVVGLAPFYNVPGDYYEMGSIVTTRAVALLTGGGLGPPAFKGIRSDDVFRLIDNLVTRPEELSLQGAGRISIAAVLIGVSLVADVLLAFLTYFAGGLVARVFVRDGGRTGRVDDLPQTSELK